MAAKDAKDGNPKAKTPKERRDQAFTKTLAKVVSARSDISAQDVEVFSATPSQGDGDWRAIVVVNGPEREVLQVGYNNETDTIFVDKLGRMQ